MLSALLHMLTSQNNPQGPQGNIRQPNALLHIRYLAELMCLAPQPQASTPHTGKTPSCGMLLRLPMGIAQQIT